MASAEQIAGALRSEVVADLLSPLDEAAAATESPIELAMLWGLVSTASEDGLLYAGGSFLPTAWMPGGDVSCRDGAHQLIFIAANKMQMTISINPTVRCGDATYRIDIGIEYREPIKGSSASTSVHLAVECDGHDFHEKTKEQAEHDKKRDRDLQSMGWSVARFTGAEIVRDAKVAARKAWSCARSVALIQAQRIEEMRERS
jgi:REase_MTES_1575